MQIEIGSLTLTQLEIIIILSVFSLVFCLYKISKSWQGKMQAQFFERINEVEDTLKDSSHFMREELHRSTRDLKQDFNQDIKNFGDNITAVVDRSSENQKDNLGNFGSNINNMRQELEQKLEVLKKSSSEDLDKMRYLVDEKLQSNLEKKLNESYKQVSERLAEVHQGLGEMKKLSVGVDDLKKALSNVKTRGTWGEVQLGNILEQVFNPSQYDKNVKTNPESDKLVEFAIKIPDKVDDNSFIYLPVDAKFPMDAYVKVIDAANNNSPEQIEAAIKGLQKSIVLQAKTIAEKYVAPPYTTDFAIMFMPTEALYAEVAKIGGLIEEVQYKHRVTIAGPSNLFALLNSLQMGFRTLAIEKHSSEVWHLLGEIKREFNEYGTTIGKVKKKLLEASNSIELVERRSRVMDKKLGKVGQINIDSAPKPSKAKPKTKSIDNLFEGKPMQNTSKEKIDS